MSKVVRDERQIAIENAGYRLAYGVLAFGLLGIIMFRSYVRGESYWDLFALLLLSGFVATAYQAAHRSLDRRWLRDAAAIVVIGAVSGVLAVIWLVSRH